MFFIKIARAGGSTWFTSSEQFVCFSFVFSFQILKDYSDGLTDWSLYSQFTQKRQRHPMGNIELPYQITQHFESPSLLEYGTAAGYQEFLYLSQICQAEELRTETEVYRRAMARIDESTGEGRTMGALYWQLNDIWPGASWTSLEYGGYYRHILSRGYCTRPRYKQKRYPNWSSYFFIPPGNWRMSHYFAEQMFTQVLVSPTVPYPYKHLIVDVVSDDLKTLDLNLVIKVQRWDQLETFHEKESNFLVDPQSVTSLFSDMETLLDKGNCFLDNATYTTRFNYCFLTFR
jgi:beta-galactosidase/beta-glucuronidase